MFVHDQRADDRRRRDLFDNSCPNFHVRRQDRSDYG